MTSEHPSAPTQNVGDVTPHSGRRPSTLRWVLETLLLVAVAWLFAQGVRHYVAEPYLIPTGSMVPTIGVGDRVVAEKLTYRFVRPPAVGEIVVFDDPQGRHPQLIKRVIATEGQLVLIRDDSVYVDGIQIREPYTHGKPTTQGIMRTPVVVPAGHLWLMGDNRTNSGDSRVFGAQPVSAVRGRAFWTYWPPRAFGALD